MNSEINKFTCEAWPEEIRDRAFDEAHKIPCMYEIDKLYQDYVVLSLLRCKCNVSLSHNVFDIQKLLHPQSHLKI